MSEFSENEKNINEEYHDEFDEFDTVFSDPQAHNDDKKTSGGKRRIISIVAAVLAVTVLIGSTVAIVKLIPELEDEQTAESIFPSITVCDVDPATFKYVTVKNSNGEFKFYSEEVDKSSETDKEGNTTVVWNVEGIDSSKTDSTIISGIVSRAASISAIREIDTKTASECGFDNPAYEVTIEPEKEEKYSVLVGDASPDGTGIYLKLSSGEEIYLVEETIVDKFDFTLLDLSDNTAIPAANFSDTTGCLSEEGTLITFDSLELSGKNFPEPVKIVVNSGDSDSAALLPYSIVAPTNRIADETNVTSIFEIFRSGIEVSGIYSYEVNADSLASVGLDNPDLVATLTVNGESFTYKISKVDGNYCAVVNQNSAMIYKAPLTLLSFAEFGVEDIYSTWVAMQSVNDIDVFTFEVDGKTYEFDITYDDSEDAEQKYTVKYNGEEINDSYFRSFYQGFVGLTCSDFTIEDTAEEVYATVKMKFNDGNTEEYKFYRVSGTAYQYSINGVDMGKVPSSAFNKVVENIHLVAQNKSVTP